MHTQGDAAAKTWGGRFAAGPDARLEAFTESISFDRRLYRHDILASQAHARMLAHVGLISAAEARQLVAGLERIADDVAAGRIEFSAKLEDIHTHVEKALVDRLGDVGKKLHTARSRNDQVVTALKLWTREAIDRLDQGLAALQRSLLGAAERNGDVILPGYTHLQRAQPVLAAHYFLAYVEKLQRDRGRLADARRRLNELPLGAAALAGTSLPIDRDFVAKELGFDRVAANSLDVASDRDFVIETASALALLALHLSGWADEWILWSTVEFGFLALPDAFCTGSSLMPHKKNPDVLELIRGKAARVIGDLSRLLVLVKGLPLAYNRDLQEDKEALFDAFDTVRAAVEIAAPLIDQSSFRRDAIAARLEEGFLDATTVMEHLVKSGVPLRTAHEALGKLVRECEARGCKLADLPTEMFEAIKPGLTPGVYAAMGVANALAAFQSAGSTAPARVAQQLALWKKRLG
jgi:argininosuccinate lyase